jgi:hypothetical protein
MMSEHGTDVSQWSLASSRVEGSARACPTLEEEQIALFPSSIWRSWWILAVLRQGEKRRYDYPAH